jgi:hypothetical protein
MLASSCVFYLAGCSGGPLGPSVKTNSVQGAAIQGTVHGGQATIAGGSLYLYAANNAGYGNASISLLNSSVLSQTPAGGKDSNGNYYVTTGSDGSFAITGDYTCPSTTSQIYLYATGGNPGGGANSAIGLLAGLGTCPANGTLSPSLFIVINEVSTVAMAYSVAGYATDPLHVSSPANTLAQTGITNAFATVTNLETLNSGVALATTPVANGGNGTVPQTEINTLANILAACINSSGPSFTPCTTLFSNAKNGSTTPTDTATAAINIAHNPGANIASLYGLQTGITAFQPMLSAQPNDFTIAVSYTGGGLSTPSAVAIDGSGNAWISNFGGNSVTELSSLGKPSSGSPYTGGGLDQPIAIAVDDLGATWVADEPFSTSSGEVTKISGGTVTGYTAGGLRGPYGIAIDGKEEVWVPNGDNSSATKLDNSGIAASGSPYTGGGLDGPGFVSIDGSGNAWFANHTTLSEFNIAGTPISGSGGYGGASLTNTNTLAIDGSGNVWVAAVTSVVKVSNAGTVPSSGYTGAGMDEPVAVAIDGSGNVWALNYGSNSDVELSNSGSILSGASGYSFPATGWGVGTPNANQAIAVDGSGNVWIINPANSAIIEQIGVATPVITPIAAGLPATPTLNGTSNLGTRP